MVQYNHADAGSQMDSVGSNRSVSPLAKSYSGYVDSFVGWNVCVQRRND